MQFSNFEGKRFIKSQKTEGHFRSRALKALLTRKRCDAAPVCVERKRANDFELHPMSSAYKIDERSAVQPQTAVDQNTSSAESKRDWPRLIAAHVKIAAISPSIAATLFTLLSPDRASLLHWGGILALFVTIACTYLFFGIFAFLAVIIVSPALALLSKIPSATIALILSITFGVAIGWIVCSIFVKDVPAFQTSAAITAALGSLALERAWRRTANSTRSPPE